MKIWISGIAGTLGSTLADHFVSKGYTVAGNDVQRWEEAWKITERDKIKYYWISSIDLPKSLLREYDILMDCGIAYADRPFGINSPITNYIGNIMPAVNIVKQVTKLYTMPTVIYFSSFNVFYGYHGNYTERTPTAPSSEYGWTKAAVESLYMTAHRQYNLPVIITRVGSEYGPKMRGDELVGKLIISFLKNRDVKLRSPNAQRLWGYVIDTLDFYDKLVERYYELNGEILHVDGNKGDRIVKNIELAHMLKEMIGSQSKIYPVAYEPGETLNGKPITFTVDSSYSRKLIGWYPKYTLEEGLSKTVEWFKENLWRYV